MRWCHLHASFVLNLDTRHTNALKIRQKGARVNPLVLQLRVRKWSGNRKRTNQSKNQVGTLENKNAHSQEGDKSNEGDNGSKESENTKKDTLNQEGAKKNDGGAMSNV